MKIFTLRPTLLFCFLLFSFWACSPEKEKRGTEAETTSSNAEKRPDDWFFAQRAFPHNQINRPVYRNARKQARIAQQQNLQRTDNEWESVGPTDIGGRITDIVLDPNNQNVIYAGAASGGIFKSTDRGSSWIPIFDETGTLSIGDLAIDPTDSSILYAGTGESNGSFDSAAFPGNGVYKSTDGGTTWTNQGLENTEHIGRIIINPENTDQLFVAATGTLYGKSTERGVYRSDDGGATWEQTLFISDSTAVVDLAINPDDPNIVFAVSWERLRYPWGRIYGGPTSGVYRSQDGGSTWTKLENGLPESNGNTGRIGIYIAPSNPNRIFAVYTTNPITNQYDGLYRSDDGGDSWIQVNTDIDQVFSFFGWYFGNIRVSPTNPDEIYVLGQILMKSTDGGLNFEEVTQEMHVDFHAMEYHPENPNLIVIGNDGGLYISPNSGNSWTKSNTLPITQFYACELDEQFPNRYYGGAQDNGTSRTLSGFENDYDQIFGGDGFYVIVDPQDNDYIYLEFQNGNIYRSTNGGLDFQWAQDGILQEDRHNWNTPIVMDRNMPNVLYTGTQRLYKTTTNASFWSPISPDLTNGQHPNGSGSFATITTIDVSQTNENVLYVGTDDGNVQMTPDGGTTWNNITAGLPERFVTRVAIDPVDPLTCYVTLSGYRYVDYQPHVLKTTDGGQNWLDISGNLPEVPANDIIIDPENEGYLYLATDLGVYFSIDDGLSWTPLGTGLPIMVMTDLRLHEPSRKLLVATYGRSFYTYDLNELNVSTQDIDSSFEWSVFPNPVQERLTLLFELEQAQQVGLRLVDMTGREVAVRATEPFSNGKQEINWTLPAQLTSGSYLLRMEMETGIVVRQVVVF